ncbi:MAG: hypothetical protein IPM34_01180 [Saprospiraceae bacterium]|nr:hypothetical protein [Saprospiraceae bacterium]
MIYQQLALIASILGGFAFTFFAAVVFQPRPHKIYMPVLLLSIASTICMFVCTLGWSFIAINEHRGAENIGELLKHHHKTLSMLFLLGIVALITCIGLSGWLHSKKAGIASVFLALAGFIYVVYLMSHFIH